MPVNFVVFKQKAENHEWSTYFLFPFHHGVIYIRLTLAYSSPEITISESLMDLISPSPNHVSRKCTEL